MNPTTSHTIAAGGGGVVAAALVAAISQTWHFDPELVSNWIIVGMAAVALPYAALYAYLVAKAKTDPALAAVVAELPQPDPGDVVALVPAAVPVQVPVAAVAPVVQPPALPPAPAAPAAPPVAIAVAVPPPPAV